MIAGNVDLARAEVDQHDREHAVEPLEHAVEAVLFVEIEDDFGVGGAPEPEPGGFELLAIVEGVVDLAVERQHHRAVVIHHRLMAAFREVENLQAVEAERAFELGAPRQVTRRQLERMPRLQ